METGEFASHMVHGLHSEALQLQARHTATVKLCGEVSSSYLQHKERMVGGERATNHVLKK